MTLGDDVLCKNWYLLEVKKQDLGTSKGILGDQNFRGAPSSFLYGCPPPLEVHIAIFTDFAKRQISKYLVQWPIVTQSTFAELSELGPRNKVKYLLN